MMEETRYVLPAEPIELEELRSRGLEVTWVCVGEPRVVSGVAFEQSHRDEVLQALGVEPGEYTLMPTDLAGHFLLGLDCETSKDAITRRSYVKLCRLRFSKEITELEKEISRAEVEVSTYLSRATELLSDLQVNRARLEGLRTAFDARGERYAQEFDKLVRHRMVKQISIGDIMLSIHTQPVIIRHGRRRYLIGSFRIDLCSNGRVVIENLCNTSGIPNAIHPHVSATTTCFGNIDAALAKLLGEFEYVLAAYLILEWLETYNPRDCLHPISSWQVIEEVPGSKEEATEQDE